MLITATVGLLARTSLTEKGIELYVSGMYEEALRIPQ
jgi:hypothetical protein